MSKLTYINGDATSPVGSGQKIIIHVCNDVGAWGAGFVIAISKKWKEPQRAYLDWYKDELDETGRKKGSAVLTLGQVQFVPVENDIEIGNMIGQHNVGMIKGKPPIRYNAIRAALQVVCTRALGMAATVHAPRFGAGLAGGDWNTIEQIINEELVDKGIDVTIYDYVPPIAISMANIKNVKSATFV
jgi:O-acetyl-ADP-ribose deacetylase (regulator of RNase III)